MIVVIILIKIILISLSILSGALFGAPFGLPTWKIGRRHFKELPCCLQESGVAKVKERPSNATWHTRSWGSTPSSCLLVSWSPAMPESPPSSSVNVTVRPPTSSSALDHYLPSPEKKTSFSQKKAIISPKITGLIEEHGKPQPTTRGKNR